MTLDASSQTTKREKIPSAEFLYIKRIETKHCKATRTGNKVETGRFNVWENPRQGDSTSEMRNFSTNPLVYLPVLSILARKDMLNTTIAP